LLLSVHVCFMLVRQDRLRVLSWNRAVNKELKKHKQV